MARPDFIVIGAKKSGTTSLHRYLALHPEIAMAEPRELDFFIAPGPRWELGLSWYESRFDPRAPVRGESSPSYAAFPYVQGVPERIASIVPGARLVYLVRDPVERMVSQYGQHWGSAHQRRPISDLFADPSFATSDFVTKSRYWLQIEQFLGHFDRERLLVVAQEDLLADRRTTLARIFRFVGADDSFDTRRFERRHNVARDRRLPRRLMRWSGRGRTRRPINRLLSAPGMERLLSRPMPRHRLDPGVRELAASYVRDDVRELRRFTGERFERWSV